MTFGSLPHIPEPLPPRLTDAFLCARYFETYDATVYAAGRFWRCHYEDNHWVPLPDAVLAAEVLEILESYQAEGAEASSRRVAAIHDLLRIRLDAVSLAEGWRLPPGTLPLRSYLLDLATLSLTEQRADRFPGPPLPYNFDLSARCPAWEAFLTATLPEASAFLQEFAGYCLTDDIHHELSLWLYGPANSGKSTVLHGLETLLGPRAAGLPVHALLRRQLDANYLFGRSLLISHETPTDPDSLLPLSAMTSGETLTLSGPHGLPVPVHNRAKFALAFNDLPMLAARHASVYRRAALVVLPGLPSQRQDSTLKDRIAVEGPGLLNWALVGLARLRARGRFELPAAILRATDQMRFANASPAVFVAECCLPDPNARTPGSHLQFAYLNWCQRHDLKPRHAKLLAEEFRRQGFERHRSNGHSHWQGVSLLPGHAPSVAAD
jgi:P4 family phage/plasmid primase-like protien